MNRNHNIEKIYYYTPQITFSEVPDEISLTIPTLCYPPHCSQDCNSKSLCWIENWKGKKEELTKEIIWNLIMQNEGITCVTIMTSLNFKALTELFKFIKSITPSPKFPYVLKTALYIGLNKKDVDLDEWFNKMISYLDYLKVGPFDKKFGPLDNPNTNQKFYKITHLDNKDFFECKNDLFINN